MTRWQTLWQEERGYWRVPARAGVYVIYLTDGRMYIGSSINMMQNRMYGHHEWMKRVSILKVKYKEPARWPSGRVKRQGEWLVTELRLIAWVERRHPYKLLNEKQLKNTYMLKERRAVQEKLLEMPHVEVHKPRKKEPDSKEVKSQQLIDELLKLANESQ